MGYYTSFEIDVFDIKQNIPSTEVLDSFKYLLCQADEDYKYADGAFYDSSIFATNGPITEQQLMNEVIHYLIDMKEIKTKEEFSIFMFRKNAGIKIFQALCEYPENASGEAMKWYDYEKDMKKLSSFSDNIVWIVSGVGEEKGDMWKAYFKGGKMQKCEAMITYEDYNESKLQ